MIHKQESGAANVLLLSLIVVALLLVAALAFGGWAYMGREDYKNNVDAKVSVAVKDAKAAEAQSKELEFAERSKNPLKTYTGPAEYGSISMQYPKTWSGYVTRAGGDGLLDAYFNPDVVNDVTSDGTAFALHIKVQQDAYSTVLESYSGQVQDGTVTVQPYTLPKLPNVVGSKVQGQIEDTKKGTVIVLPLRDKTLSIFTETGQFDSDFNNIILPNFTFSP